MTTSIAREPFHSIHQDHGLEWNRHAGREWAQLAGHSLVVFPRLHEAGFHFAVLDDETQLAVLTGTADTRPDARKLAVRGLGHLLATASVEAPTTDVLTERKSGLHGEGLRFASAILLAVAVGVIVASALLAVAR